MAHYGANPVGATSKLESDEDGRQSGEAAGERWVRPKGHLLPFCSHNNLKHP
jgi:hypothetical protein